MTDIKDIKKEDEGIILNKEEYASIITALDELKTLKNNLTTTEANSRELLPEQPTTVRGKILDSENKENELLRIENEVEKETGLREYLFEKANALGGRSTKIAEEFKENYYKKGFATKKTNSEFLKEFLTEIATDKEVNQYIPKYKEQEIKQFLELPENTIDEKDYKLQQARKHLDVVNAILEIKGRTEEQLARVKANNSFGNSERDATQQRHYIAVEKFKDNVKQGKGLQW